LTGQPYQRPHRPRLLAVNQSVSVLFRELVEGFVANDVEVTLLAGELEQNEGYVPQFTWLKGCKLHKASAWRRIWTWGKFTLQAAIAMITHRRDLQLVVTNPPTVPWVASLLKRLWGVRYVDVVYDIFPEVLSRMGVLQSKGLIYRFLRHLSVREHQDAQCVITLGECMKNTVLGHLDDGQSLQVHVIPNWADVDFIKPLPKESNPFALAHNLADKFVVMYSGAFGASHDIDSIVLAAERLQEMPNVRVVLIGGGTRLEHVRRLVNVKRLPNLMMLPWQSIDQVKYSLASADCHIVCTDQGYEGVSVPSKLYTALAAGAAILAVSQSDTELTRVIARHDCGLWLQPRDVEGLAAAIRRLHDEPLVLARMKLNARQTAVQFYSKEICVQKYVELIMPLLRQGG
jgi:glycosyltransferase involved in cell wall biosynthesis